MRFFAVVCGLSLLFSAMVGSSGMWMFDPTSLLIVIFGGSLHVLARGGLRQRFEEVVSNFGDGQWGWLSMLVGLVGTGAHYTVDRGPELPAAVAVALLSVLTDTLLNFWLLLR